MNIKSNKIILAVIAVLSFVFAYLYDKWKYISEYIESIKHSEDNLKDAIEDEYGVKYSRDGKKLLEASSSFREKEYVVRKGTEVICDRAFRWCESLQSVTIPNSVTSIGDDAFRGCMHLDEPSRLRLKELNYTQFGD